MNCGTQWTPAAKARTNRGCLWMLVISVCLLALCNLVSETHPPSTASPVAATAAPAPVPVSDAVDLFVAQFGAPDEDDSTLHDDPRPPIVTRWLVYKSEHVRVTYVFDNDGETWTFLAFQDQRSKQPITATEAKKRLTKRAASVKSAKPG
jgi:hypothetical protein